MIWYHQKFNVMLVILTRRNLPAVPETAAQQDFLNQIFPGRASFRHLPNFVHIPFHLQALRNETSKTWNVAVQRIWQQRYRLQTTDLLYNFHSTYYDMAVKYKGRIFGTSCIIQRMKKPNRPIAQNAVKQTVRLAFVYWEKLRSRAYLAYTVQSEATFHCLLVKIRWMCDVTLCYSVASCRPTCITYGTRWPQNVIILLCLNSNNSAKNNRFY